MAESQLEALEDGQIPPAVPESRPQFYYSERQRVALEQLITGGDGAFKTYLKEEQSHDFLSAREIKNITGSFVKYQEEDGGGPGAERGPGGAKTDSMHSTYWPQMSDTEVPPLDMGWPSSGLFKGVTRVFVHTHPPKPNSPHIKEVARKLIQEASKVIAIVMDLLTDLQILQDVFEASQRGVPVYIVLDLLGVPHFLDMCSRMQVGAKQLQNVRTRTVRGVGLNLSMGRIPGNVHSKYMLIDGDKVMFGTYSFCWSSSRMDRNMITVMSGQIVDFYDHDFRELYANSDKLDLFKEFHLSKPQTGTLSRAAVSKRPPAATSRFQVNLGDATRGDLKIPAHKYHNPKYLLALGQIPGPAEPMQEFLKTMEPQDPEDLQEDLQREPENLPVETEKKKHKTFKKKKKKKKQDNNTSDVVIEDNTSKHATLNAEENIEKTSMKKRRSCWTSCLMRSK